MNDTDILHTLDQACQGLNLIFQVVWENETLYIYINRPAQQTLEYESLSGTLQGAIAALEIPHLENVCLYSRELGTVEPDWETLIPLNAAGPHTNDHPVPDKMGEAVVQEFAQSSPETSAIASERPEPEIGPIPENTDLSHYCFTRNRALLTSDILPPSDNIARLVQAFDALLLPQKQEVLPLLDSCFRGNRFPSGDELGSETQAWLHQLAQLNSADLRKAALWMSRYCFNPDATMGQVGAILSPDQTVPPVVNAAPTSPQALTQAPSSSDSEYSLAHYAAAPARPRITPAPERMILEPSVSRQRPREKSQPHLVRYALLVPLIWLLCTATIVILDVQAQKNPQISEEFCKTSGSQPYCQLAVQLLGTDRFQQFQKETATAPPMIDAVKEKSVTDCESKAYFNAGFTLKDGIEKNIPKNPVVKLQQETVFPGLFVVDVEFAGKTAGTVRTACAYRQVVDPVMLREHPLTLAASVIPTDWPTQPYENKIYRDPSKLSWTIPNLLRHISTNTLFTAIGLFVAVYFGLGIHVDSLGTLYKSAFFLGISDTLAGFIPLFGFLRVTLLGVLSLMLTTVVVKDFTLDWSAGYRLIVSGALVIIFIRILLNWLLFSTIVSFMT